MMSRDKQDAIRRQAIHGAAWHSDLSPHDQHDPHHHLLHDHLFVVVNIARQRDNDVGIRLVKRSKP